MRCEVNWRKRLYTIVDCCFSATAVKEFQGDTLATTVAMTQRAFPGGGTALLCSTTASDVSIAPVGEEFTMFSGALINVLKTLNSVSWRSRLSLEQIGKTRRER